MKEDKYTDAINVIDGFTLFVVMLSCVYAYVQSHQNAYIKHMHLFVYVHHSKVEKNQKVYRFLKQLSILIEKEIKF